MMNSQLIHVGCTVCLKSHIQNWNYLYQQFIEPEKRVLINPRYCQLISDVNKEKRLSWCEQIDMMTILTMLSLQMNVVSNFNNIVENAFEKKGQQKKFKPVPKHTLKVHMWGGISARGIGIFTRKLCATKLFKIFETSLVPFITNVYPDGHRLMQDNAL